MNLSLPMRAQIDALSGALGSALQTIVSSISAGYHVEHNDDDSHSTIHASGDVLAATGLGTFGGQHRAFVKIGSNITLTSGVETVLTWAAPLPDGTVIGSPDSGWNVGGMYDPTLPTLVTARVKGLYLVSYAVRFVGNATGVRYAFVVVSPSGHAPADLAQCYHGAHASGNTVAESLILPMGVGDTVSIEAQQNSGGGLDVVSGFLNSWLQVTKIG